VLTNEGVVRLERPDNDPKLSTPVKLAGAFGVGVGDLLKGIKAAGGTLGTPRRPDHDDPDREVRHGRRPL
jgi:hypothetical protein